MSLSNETDDNNKITLEQKITLKKKISKMSKQNCITILQFLIKENINFTENSNGIFFNLKLLNNQQIFELLNLVSEIENEIIVNKKDEIISIPEKEDNTNLHHIYEKYIKDDNDF